MNSLKLGRYPVDPLDNTWHGRGYPADLIFNT
jgi:hypothetical protein